MNPTVWKALLPVRYALKGWAFAANPAAYITNAETRLAEVPEVYRPAGQRMIDEVKDAFR